MFLNRIFGFLIIPKLLIKVPGHIAVLFKWFMELLFFRFLWTLTPSFSLPLYFKKYKKIKNHLRKISAGPPCGGHQAAGHPCVIPFPVYHVSYVYSSQSQDSQFRSQDLWSQVSMILEWLLLGPGDPPFTTNPEGSQDLGWPQNHFEKSSNFKPVSSTTKVMKIGRKGNQNHEKWSLESWETRLLWKPLFAILPLPNAWFFNPRHPDWDPKSIRKNSQEINVKKSFLLLRRYPKNFQSGTPKSAKNL